MEYRKRVVVTIMKIFIGVICVFCSLFANWKDKYYYENIYKIDKFRIFYTFVGKDAIPKNNLIDKNNNKIPDIVEDIGLQLQSANKVFQLLGFKDPFFEKRYLGKLDYIDIHIKEMKYNGRSGDAPIKYNYSVVKNKKYALTISISNIIKSSNLTPLHELFHAFQNGTTMFKNSWLSEGTARWSEYIFRKGVGTYKNSLPKNTYELEELFKKSYSASNFWNRLGYLCGQENKYNDSEIKNIRYLTNKKINYDNKILGYDFISNVYKELSLIEKDVENKFNYKKYKWKEKEQKSVTNNKYILKAIIQTINKDIENCKKNIELYDFLKISKNYIR